MSDRVRSLHRAALAGVALTAAAALALRLPPAAAGASVAPGAFPALAASARVPEHGLRTAVLSGGCFWGMEEVFESLRGVKSVEAGYSGGAAATAHYEMVSTGLTGHAESIRITYDSAVVSYETLLRVDFSVAHDPTEKDRQGPDDGNQYRSVVFYTDAAQERMARAYVAQLTAAHEFGAPIVTEIVPLRAFYPAESYHQHYARLNPQNPYIVEVDGPKMQALRERYPSLLAPNAA